MSAAAVYHVGMLASDRREDQVRIPVNVISHTG